MNFRIEKTIKNFHLERRHNSSSLKLSFVTCLSFGGLQIPLCLSNVLTGSYFIASLNLIFALSFFIAYKTTKSNINSSNVNRFDRLEFMFRNRKSYVCLHT